MEAGLGWALWMQVLQLPSKIWSERKYVVIDAINVYSIKFDKKKGLIRSDIT